jgi:hypothetical protein
MLTLGLMEGIFAAAAMALLFFMAMEMNLPLHRIFGPPVVLIAGFIGYTVYDQGVLTSGWQVLGLLAGATFAFFIPLGVLALAWNLQRVPKAVAAPARVTEPVPTPEPAVEPRVKVRPRERTRERTPA